MPNYRIHSGPVFFCDTLRQVATVVTETAQLGPKIIFKNCLT